MDRGWGAQQAWAREWWLYGRWLAPTHGAYWRGTLYWLLLWLAVRLGLVLAWGYRVGRAYWRWQQAARREAAEPRAYGAEQRVPTVRITVHVRGAGRRRR